MIVVVVLATACSEPGGAVPGAPADLESRAVEGVGLAAPVGVTYDPVADRYLVSSLGPGAEGEGGFISRVRPNGRIDALRWIDGSDGTLRTPRGLAIGADTLFVADGPCLRRFHRASGAALPSTCLPDAVLLTDVAVDDHGVVYLVDRDTTGADPSRASTVYALRTGGPEAVRCDGDDSPAEAITFGPRGLFVATSGLGRIYQLAPDRVTDVIVGRGAHLAGIVFTPDGSFAFSNRTDSTVLFVEAQRNGVRGNLWTLVRGLRDPGRPGYDARRNRVLIPETGRDRLVLVGLDPRR